MNIRELTAYINKIVNTIPIVCSFNDVDPYSYWNSQEVKYGSVIFAVKGYTRLESVNRYNCILYYGDRVLPDESNVNNIYTDAQNVINHVLGNITLSESNINIMEGSPSVTLFRQRFLDDLAGGYCNFTIEDAEMIGDCGYNMSNVVEPDDPITPDTYIFNIVRTPSNATVIINGEERNSVVATGGTLIEWSVSTPGYTTQSGALRLNEDTTLRIDLEPVQYTYSINAIPADAVVRINGEVRNFITAGYGTEIVWEVSKIGYKSEGGMFYLTADRTDTIELEIAQHVFHIDQTPADALVIINGEEINSIIAPYGTPVTWSVSKDHYVTQSGSFILTEDRTIDVNLALERFTFVINPTPSDAVVTINGERRSSITADYGTPVVWSVSKDHYVTQSDSFILTSDVTRNVTIEIEQFTFTINPSPADATVMINGEERSHITADYGTLINWSVYKIGYGPRTGSFTLVDDTIENVTLVEEYHTFSITATPVDAIIVINGQQRSSITAGYGTSIEWSVSKSGYTSQSGSYLLVSDRTEIVNLAILQYTFTINPTPNDATVMINGQQRSSITADYGTAITWSVSRTGYTSQNGVATLTQDHTENVSLVINQYTFTVSVIEPAESTVIINGEERYSITADYGTYIEWSASAEGYETVEGYLNLESDYLEEITLYPIEYTVTINSNPDDATVIINGDETSEVVVGEGDTISWRVEKYGYITQSGTLTVTDDVTLNITLVSLLDKYLTFEVLSGGDLYWICTHTSDTTSYEEKTIQYRVNGGQWTSITSGDTTNPATISSLVRGDIVEFRGDNDYYSKHVQGPPYVDFYNNFRCSSNLRVNISGNIMSLIDSTDFSQLDTIDYGYAFRDLFSHLSVVDASGLVLPAITLSEACYWGLFEYCQYLETPPEILPADTLEDYCYTRMFCGDTSLTTNPILPATELAYHCYVRMFWMCSGLEIFKSETLPDSDWSELPATELEEMCYEGMFYDCTGLIKAPDLPANTLVTECYKNMFRGCSSLETVNCWASDISATDCTTGWLSNASASGDFYGYQSAGWTTGVDGIPSGWTAHLS